MLKAGIATGIQIICRIIPLNRATKIVKDKSFCENLTS